MNATNVQQVISPVNVENRKELDVRAGDTVRVHQKIQEKDKTRTQVFEGVVLARKHGNEPGATFTVRRTSGGYGVEKIFPIYSPMIDKIEIVRRAKVRRSKIYYIREKAARQIRRQMRRMLMLSRSTTSDMEEKQQARTDPSTPLRAGADEENQATVEEQVPHPSPEATEGEATSNIQEEDPSTPLRAGAGQADETSTPEEPTETPEEKTEEEQKSEE